MPNSFLKIHRESAENGAVFCDVPTLPCPRSWLPTLNLQADKARGTQLGAVVYLPSASGNRSRRPEGTAAVRSAKAASRQGDVLLTIAEVKAEGAQTLRAIAAELNARAGAPLAGRMVFDAGYAVVGEGGAAE